jgi:uncharacterized DUF497 family protein
LVTFTWSARKAATNLRKHGVDFREAATVFYDPLSITFPDDEHSKFELRFLTIGSSVRGKVLIIAHTEEGDDTISNYQRPFCHPARVEVL